MENSMGIFDIFDYLTVPMELVDGRMYLYTFMQFYISAIPVQAESLSHHSLHLSLLYHISSCLHPPPSSSTITPLLNLCGFKAHLL